MYQGSTEDEEGGEAVTEGVTGAVFEVEEGDTALTEAVAGTCLSVVMDALANWTHTVDEDAAIN